MAKPAGRAIDEFAGLAGVQVDALAGLRRRVFNQHPAAGDVGPGIAGEFQFDGFIPALQPDTTQHLTSNVIRDLGLDQTPVDDPAHVDTKAPKSRFKANFETIFIFLKSCKTPDPR